MDKLTVWCHVHGGLWQRGPGFFSTPLVKAVVDEAGIKWSVPVMACDHCKGDAAAVRAAYQAFIGSRG